jgi:hypothetical protein
MENNIGKPMKTTVFQLNGGLGNQLFIYFAGIYHQQCNNKIVSYDISQREKGFTNHGSKIETLGFQLPTQKAHFAWNTLGRIDKSIRIRGFPEVKMLNQISAKKIWQSLEIGYTGNLQDIPVGAFVSGHFQSHLYVDLLPKEKIQSPLRMQILSHSKIAPLAESALSDRPIMVHIRRGDYKKLRDTFGLLSQRYYKNALSAAREMNPRAPIWVFSDEVTVAKELINFKTLPPIKFIDVPENNAEATLMLLTLGSGHVISNSTFAWWGTYLSESSQFTIAPREWFKNLPTPKHLCPPHWKLINSTWE